MFSQKRVSTSKHDSIYSSSTLIENACTLLSTMIEDKDWQRFNLVDFSAGDDAFCKAMSSMFGNRIEKIWSYDLVPKAPSVKKRDWFKVKSLPGLRKYPYKLIIGFNPPFGYRNQFALAFLNHAVEFEPDILISVVPRSMRELEFDDYTAVHSELLDPFKSFIKRGGIYGAYLRVWRLTPGTTYTKSKKRKRNVQVPEGMRMITNHRDHDVKWHTENTLFIRRSGWNPGLKLVYCDKSLNLHMIDPKRTYTAADVTPELINNSIKVYNAYTITDPQKIKWKEDTTENLLYAVWDRIKSIDIDRNESMMPYIGAHALWDALSPSIVKIV